MKCDNCGAGPIEAGLLFRANPKGELPAVWLCPSCGGRCQEDLQDLIKAIQDKKEPTQ